jgi:Sulfatase
MRSNTLDLLVVTCLAFAQPVFYALARNPGFLVAHQVHLVDVIALFLIAVFVPTAALMLVELLVRQISERAAALLHVIFLAALSAVVFLLILKNVFPDRNKLPVLSAGLAGVLFAICYTRWIKRRISLAVLSPVLLLFPGAFLINGAVRKILSPARPHLQAVDAKVPVVMVIFDEFPLSSLLGRDGMIDSQYFPAFASLSHEATWFRNTTAASDGTLYAVPAILDGNRPDVKARKLPNSTDHPNSLFTLLGGSYRMNVSENLTHVCPPSLCVSGPQSSFAQRITSLISDTSIVVAHVMLPEQFAKSLPDISQAWAGFAASDGAASAKAFDDDAPNWDDRAGEVRRFIGSIQNSSRPTLNFLHVLLPHGQWEFLPNGQRYRPVAKSRIRGLVGPNTKGVDPDQWSSDGAAARESYQRFIWQTIFVDKLVGELVDHMKAVGLYDRCLLVVTADHGASFRPDTGRRLVDPGNQPDIMWVPLFIKLPGQRDGRIDSRNAETIDVFPTIADALRISLDHQVDGQSLISNRWRDRGDKVITSINGRSLQASASRDGLQQSIDRKFTVFPGWDLVGRVYQKSESEDFLGKHVTLDTVSALRYQLDWPTLYETVRAGSRIVPSDISGSLISESSGVTSVPDRIAVAVNGVIRGTATPYLENNRRRFTFLVPPESFRDGRNSIDVFEMVSTSAGAPEFARLAATNEAQYTLGTLLSFSQDGNAAHFQTEGWNEPETGLTWTSDKHSALFLPMPPPPRDVLLRANLTTFPTPSGTRSVRVHVLANGVPVGEWQVGSAFSQKELLVPRKAFDGKHGVEIAFDVPEAASPRALRAGPDQRMLGVAVATLSLN